jgi:UDP-N-acetylglucosamine 2-epimerase
MKILNVVGTRPQYIKLAPIIQAQLASGKMTPLTIDTGQHYDAAMSQVFYDNFGLEAINLNALRNGKVMSQFGDMIDKIGAFVEQEKPDYVLVFGDTNTTLAAALVAGKLQIPFGHIEAGVRTGGTVGPQEEINRILTDKMATHLFTTDQECSDNLTDDGISADKVFLVGDVMLDAFHLFSERVATDKTPVSDRPQVLLTIHRSENTDTHEVLQKIYDGILAISDRFEVIFPIHPRTDAALKRFGMFEDFSNITKIVSPLSYFELLRTYQEVDFVISDSGGVPKEAAYAGKASIVLRSIPIWNELAERGSIFCCNPYEASFVELLLEAVELIVDLRLDPIGFDKSASEEIISTIIRETHPRG